MDFDITSPSNQRIKWLVRLRDRKYRDDEGVFAVEGPRLYDRALGAGFEPIVTFVSDPALEGVVGDLVTVAPDVLDKASYRSKSQNLIAVFQQVSLNLGDLDPGPSPLLLIAENVEKPGNLGAMCRTAAAVGVDAVITIGEIADRWNPNTLRASTGAVLTVPVVASSWDEVGPWLEERGVLIVAASPDATQSLWESDLTGPIAVVIGAEDEGLSGYARSFADRLVAISQLQTGVDSLNASVAAAVVLFEAVRQRRVGG